MTFNIESTSKQNKLCSELNHKIDNLNKPKGSLGRLEELALQLGLIQQTVEPELRSPCHILLGADHGVEREDVSVSPRCITWQQMQNFTRGGGGVNMFCRQHGFKLRIVDVGVDYDLSNFDAIENFKIRPNGTGNFLFEDAMSEQEAERCFEVGCRLVDECFDEGTNIVSFGEMGIGNTSPSSVWMSMLLNIPLEECVGAGAGLDNEGVRHKYEVLRTAVDNFGKRHQESVSDVLTIMRCFGGLEMVTAVGGMLRAAERRMVVLVDGFIMSACALVAMKLYPSFADYAVFGHVGDESGHRCMLDAMGVKPILNLGLRLGEGTGAICAFPIVDSAVRMIREMNNFDNARITKYF